MSEKQPVNNIELKPNTPSNTPETPMSGCLAVSMRRIAIAVVGILVFFVVTGVSRWFSSNNNMQKEAEIHLNALIEAGAEFPLGEYVDFEARWVVGPYAKNTQSRKIDDDISATLKEIKYYYAVLEDGTIMSIATTNAAEKESLSRMSDWLLSVEDFPMDGETFLLRGKLAELSNEEVAKFYTENAKTIFGLPTDSPALRRVVLDTEAGREGGYMIASAVVIVAVFLIVLLRMKIKKNKQEKAKSEHFDTFEDSVSED